MANKKHKLIICGIFLIIFYLPNMLAADFDDRINRMRNRINELENFMEDDPAAGAYRGKSDSYAVFSESKNDLVIKEIKSIGFAGMDDGEMLSPKGMTTVGGKLYVADSDNARVQILTFEGRHIKSITKASIDGYETLKKPVDVAYFNRKIYVVDKKKDKVYVYTIDGQFVNSFGGFDSPRSIDIDTNGNIYVCDSGKKAVYVFDNSGRSIQKIDSLDKINKMYMPIDIEVSNHGTIYVLDKSRRSIIEYDRNYKFICETKLSEYTKWVRSMDVDNLGNVYVVTDDPSILVFDFRFNLKGKIRKNLYKPDIIHVDSDKMYVSDFRKHSIYVYEVYL